MKERGEREGGEGGGRREKGRGGEGERGGGGGGEGRGQTDGWIREGEEVGLGSLGNRDRFTCSEYGESGAHVSILYTISLSHTHTHTHTHSHSLYCFTQKDKGPVWHGGHKPSTQSKGFKSLLAYLHGLSPFCVTDRVKYNLKTQ